MADAKITTDHDEIRKWADARGHGTTHASRHKPRPVTTGGFRRASSR